MGKLVIIGGGEICLPDGTSETLLLDKYALSLTNKKQPKLLFVPTASGDSLGYIEKIETYFGKKLGCVVCSLCLCNNPPSQKEIEQKILGSDIIYVGGGNTLKMMTLWRKLGVDKMLMNAYHKNIVLTGLSAGGICWFRQGNSDSRKFQNKDAPMIKVTGIGLINALHCPHYSSQRGRKLSLKDMMKKTPGVGIAIDNCCALSIVDEQYQVISTNTKANAYKVYWQNGTYIHEELSKDKKPHLLKDLVTK